ncbi:Ubiquinone/menaquinone biosynthesis C-methylase UbiE [Paracoccus isoporae]|uniref:Ubiquinone/menaquinone biosynthesis C-methylase UbiE n=1 Tax=Paracoccus isoporae TaxID=591205 RepID=A0A1G6T5W0_9RHOB|nr:class I SAM-dependent methyltransferase [Paracoccus isoporae]SDD24419.1 Ubiquinone/menaquinone biosynthesis C-methylase UbiE [Paracoccus isoporae]
MSRTDDSRFWDRTSEKYAKSKISDPEGYERTLTATRALLSPECRVLELGCGTGSTALRLADAAAAYLATDISPEMIAIAQEKLAVDPVAGLVFRVATAEDLVPEPPGYDAVLGFNYLHLVRDLPGTLRRIHALLAPGGVFVSKTPCVGDMALPIRLVVPVMRAIGKAPFVTMFGMAELRERIEAAGFVIERAENHASKGGRSPALRRGAQAVTD